MEMFGFNTKYVPNDYGYVKQLILASRPDMDKNMVLITTKKSKENKDTGGVGMKIYWNNGKAKKNITQYVESVEWSGTDTQVSRVVNFSVAHDYYGKTTLNIKLGDFIYLKEDIQEYFKREVLPFARDAWIDEKKNKVGYEIPFTRYFYKII